MVILGKSPRFRGVASSPAGMRKSRHAPFDRFGELQLPATALGLLQEVRRQVMAGSAWPWQSIFDDLRANGQRIWQSMELGEQSRFLRHLRIFWDVHRYRIAPQLEAIINRKRQNGSLTVLAAELRGVEANADNICLTLQPRHGLCG